MKTFNDIRFQDLKEGLYDPNIFRCSLYSYKTFVTRSALKVQAKND